MKLDLYKGEKNAIFILTQNEDFSRSTLGAGRDGGIPCLGFKYKVGYVVVVAATTVVPTVLTPA